MDLNYVRNALIIATLLTFLFSTNTAYVPMAEPIHRLEAQKLDHGLQVASSSYCSDRVKVVIELSDVCRRFGELFKRLDVDVESLWGNMIQANLPCQNLKALAESREVDYVRYPAYPTVFQAVSEGVLSTRADLLHDKGVLGEGVDVAVIDVGFDVSNPEISPNIAEAKSFRFDKDITGSSEEEKRHGTGVSEIIIDIAPRSRLYLYNFETDIEFLNAVDYAISKKVDILSISVGFVNVGPYDGTSYIAQAIDKAWQSGIVVLTAAGNEAHRHWSGTFTDEDGDGFNEFYPGDETNEIQVSAGSWVRVYLSWDDWPNSNQDYDMYLYDESLNLVAFSANPQTGIQPPTERIIFLSPTTSVYRIVIGRSTATRNVDFKLFSFEQDLEYFISKTSLTSPADAKGTITVGAANFMTDQIEPFSSQGPTVDGRIKPDLTAPDGVTTTSFIPDPFYGTSASAPHVAGLAALLKSIDLNLTPDGVKSILEETSVDLGPPGKDNIYGAGRIDAYAAMIKMIGSPTKYSLNVIASTPDFQYPTLPPYNLSAEVTVEYEENSFNVSENRTTPFKISVDEGTVVKLSMRNLPQGYEWIEWDIHGFGRTTFTSIEISMKGDRVAIAYVKSIIERPESAQVFIHAHTQEHQYPQEPSTELEIYLRANFIVNGSSKEETLHTGPNPLTLTVDFGSTLKLEVIQIPQGYAWHEWDEYGVGRTPSMNITVMINEYKTLIAYLTHIPPIQQGDFTISAQPRQQYYIPGQTVNYIISLTPTGEFSYEVSLKASNLPPPLSVTITPSVITPPGSATLKVATSPQNTAGTVTIIVNATGGNRTHAIQLLLTPYAIPGYGEAAIIIGLLAGAISIIVEKSRIMRKQTIRGARHPFI